MPKTEFTAELVIPSYNRLDVLKRTFEQIRVLYPKLDICLGLQGEMPDLKWEAELKKDTQLRIERLSVPNTTLTLNHCIFTSQADIILLLDDDAVPHFGCLESHIAAFTADPELAYTTGREIRFTKSRNTFSQLVRILTETVFGLFLDNDKKLNGRIVGWMSRSGLMFGNFDQPGICKINSPRGCNMAVRKTEFIKIKGFTETFKGNAWGFEADFGLRMARDGKFGVYKGNALVVHHEYASGGSRQADKWQWYRDFLHNHSLLIAHLGVQAWLGSLPRLTKNLLRIVFK